MSLSWLAIASTHCQRKQALQLTLWWRGVRPATEDRTAFFHITPSANNPELVGQRDHAITDHEYPPTVWAAGEVVQEQV